MSPGKLLVVLGIALVLVGVVVQLLPGIPLGRLPGDLRIERDGFRLVVPLGSCALVSLVLTLLLNLFSRLR